MERSSGLTRRLLPGLAFAVLVLAPTTAAAAAEAPTAGTPLSIDTSDVSVPELPEASLLPSAPSPQDLTSAPSPALPTAPEPSLLWTELVAPLPSTDLVAPEESTSPSTVAPTVGGGISRTWDSAAALGPRAAGAALGEAQLMATAIGRTGAAATDPAARRRVTRERLFRRKVRRLAGCLDAVSRLERRVLILRAGLGRVRPHSRRATARRLDISVERIASAERRGLRRLEAANRATGCAAGAPSSRSTGIEAVLSRLPVLLAFASPTAGPVPRSAADAEQGARGPGDEAGTPATPGAAIASDEGAGFPMVLMLALLSVMLAAALLLPGWRAAAGVAHRRAERAEDRRHDELVRAVLGVLGEPRPPRRN